MSHELQDTVSLEMARQIAAGLPQHPESVDIARANLERWSSRNRNAPSLVRSYKEWSSLLNHSVADICSILTAETDEGQRLRQNSPFAGVLSPEEVWEIKSRCRHATTAA